MLSDNQIWVISKIMNTLVGRTYEQKAIMAALRCHRHLILEGPVGVGKTFLTQLCCERQSRPFVRINADDRFHAKQLTGHHDPSIVLKNGYSNNSFVAGPLVQAMQMGAVLFINEMNRLPELTQNVLLTAMDEGILDIPLGDKIIAKTGFSVIGTQNPEAFIATQPMSEALKDRLDWLRIDYQSRDEELTIVRNFRPEADEALVERAVDIVRATRQNPKFIRGASIRAAMAIVDLTIELDGDFEMAIKMALHNRVQCQNNTVQAIDTLLAETEKKKHSTTA